MSDSPTESGFGRISNAIGKALTAHGHSVMAASVNYSGHPHNLPFWCWRLTGDIWQEVTGIINQYPPDMVIVCQDFPYAQTLLNACRVDWSKIALFNITPIDGTPIHPDWLDVVDGVNGTMVISRFGVEAMRQAGRHVGLCHPGVDTGHFNPASAEEKAALRAKAGLEPNRFVVGMAAMNQGRKNIPATLEGFAEFCKDKPNARLLLDMEKASGGGWDVPKLAKEIGVPDGRIIFREDLLKRGMTSLRDRYCIMDAHSVLSFREGFGLPLLESQACKIPSIALDWCSGTEICGGDRGVLIPAAGRPRYGTWGNARDKDPDMTAYINALNRLYYDQEWAQYIGRQGYEWARQQTWENATAAVEAELPKALENHKAKWGDTHAEVKSVVSEHYHPGLQPAGFDAQMPAGYKPNDGLSDNGSHLGGRRLAGLQSDGDSRLPGAGSPQPAEHGVRGVVQYRGDGVQPAEPLSVLSE